MFTGIQEILILVVIILGILFLPRILNRGQEKEPAGPVPPFVLSGKLRLAIAASILWPAVVAAFIQPWKSDLIPFLYLGLGPVALMWIMYWVLIGFRKKER
jgi:hypothetical protein